MRMRVKARARGEQTAHAATRDQLAQARLALALHLPSGQRRNRTAPKFASQMRLGLARRADGDGEADEQADERAHERA